MWLTVFPLSTVCYSTDLPARYDFTVTKPDRIMDEVLLGRNLRRACTDSESEYSDAGSTRHRTVILREKPRVPYIVLPDEPRFKPLKTRPRFALDIGGTLCKLVYTTVCHNEGNNELEVLLNFTKFTGLDDCVTFMQREWKDRTPEDVLHCTGGGAYKYQTLLEEKLGVRLMRVDEMHSLIHGCDFLLNNIEDESFTYHHEAKGIERYQYKPLTSDLVFPFLLVNIGTGISILKVNSETTFERIGGSSMGGGTFIGLGNLITRARGFDELLRLAEKGDHRKVDTLVSDIYGGSYDALGLEGDVIAGSFAKCNKFGRQKNHSDDVQAEDADYAKSLLLMISNNIGQMAMLYGNRYKIKRIYFGGFFIRKHPITMRTLSYAIKFWSSGECEALFMKHEGYLGAVGSFMQNFQPSNA